ncbi:MAG: hypothetical protein V3U51_02470 [Thermoplasmata archaeon]
MALKEEIEKLADACSACAEADDGSLDEHFASCSSCQEYEKKAEQMSQMVEVLQMNAAKPEEDRLKILHARIMSFVQLPDDERKDAVANMFDSLAMLSEEDRVKIVKSRTDVLTKLPKEQRMKLMGTAKLITSDWDDERKNMEMRAITAATEDYFLLKRMMVRKMFRNLIS